MKNNELEKVLLAIYDKHGELTPIIIVEEAKDPNNPLHNEFEWDDERAAQLFREDTARRILRRVPHFRTSDYRRQVRVPCFVRSPDVNPGEQGYIPLDKVERRSAQAQGILNDELKRLVSTASRAAAIAMELEFFDIGGELEELESMASVLQARLLQRIELMQAS